MKNYNYNNKLPLNFLGIDQSRTDQIPNLISLLLIDTIQSPANFIILNLITNSLRSLRPIILINFNHPIDYWFNLLTKQAIQPESNQFKPLIKTININNLEQQSLHSIIKLNLQQFHQQQQPLQTPLVIIDDLNSIIWADNRSSAQLIHSFQSILPSGFDTPCSLVTLFHQDLVQSNKRDREIFNHLINQYHIILRTRALGPQGQGELIIQRGPGYLNDLNLPITLSNDQITQYKIIDNSVSFHPKGLDKGFI